MAKNVVKQIKLQVPGGKAVPGQKLGPVLGAAGINIGDFVNKFNQATQDMIGSTVPVVISVYDDRSYDFILKKPPATDYILKAIGKDKGSGKPNTVKVGTLTKDQVRKIAEEKMEDLNASDIEQAIKVISGSARSMGVDVK